jgi:murein DD-endopeptidase MepM/ murein hydrolase activator NlpD
MRIARLGLLATLATGCERGQGVEQRFVVGTPHENYQAVLETSGLHTTALGRDWIAAAESALERSTPVALPHRERRFLDPTAAAVAAYRVTLERGQLVRVQIDDVDAADEPTQLFLDLFIASPSALDPRLVASADSLARRLEYVALQPGDYVIRVQPELLRGGRLTVTISSHASLEFPVAGRDMGAIRSRFGAPRDGGRRDHHGVDIFARRGTPVIASVAGRARATTNRLGGNVVWLRDGALPRSLYYAHLDRHAFGGTRMVEPGDTLGFVGNSGNARTTPPHLHFGIYMRRIGPVDPDAHLYEPVDRPAPFAGDDAVVGTWARTRGSDVAVRDRPARRAPLVRTLGRDAPIEIVAGTGDWYLGRLPDGSVGYVATSAVRRLATPLREARMTAGATVLGDPTPSAAVRDTVVRGDVVPILGVFGTYALVENGQGVRGWVPSSVMDALLTAERVTTADDPED